MSHTQNMYPVESINSRSRTEKRWEEDITPQSIFQDLPTNWQISLGNGKRLGRKWRKNGGIAFVPNRYGDYQTIYNKRYDVALNEAKKAQYDKDNPNFHLSETYYHH